MQLLSLNVGLPRLIEYNGEFISTGIFKTPMPETVAVNEQNLAGDGQADLRYHGGWSKAVYAYPSEHYEFWRAELPEVEFSFGVFGENLTTAGLLEAETFVGDRFRIGTAEFIVTEPRFPCSKLNLRFGRRDIVRRFQKSRRSGVYLAIAKTGVITAGDAIEFLSRDENLVSIADLVRLRDEKEDLDVARRALKVEALPEKWKRDLRKLLEKAG